MRGGKRPGAGRKPGPVDMVVIGTLAGRIRLESDPERRLVIALASLGAEPVIIAAALGIEEAEAVTRHGRAIDEGRIIMHANTLNLLWRRGKAGNVSALINLLKISDAAQRAQNDRRPQISRDGRVEALDGS